MGGLCPATKRRTQRCLASVPRLPVPAPRPLLLVYHLLAVYHLPPVYHLSRCRFYFWVDVIATVSILIDMPAIMDPIINGVSGCCPSGEQ